MMQNTMPCIWRKTANNTEAGSISNCVNRQIIHSIKICSKNNITLICNRNPVFLNNCAGSKVKNELARNQYTNNLALVT